MASELGAGGDPAPRTSVDARDAGRGALSLLGVQIAARAMGVLFVLVAARAVSPAAFAQYSVAGGSLVLGGFLADLGTSAAITRIVARGDRKPETLLTETTASCFLLGVLAAAAVVAFGAVTYEGPTFQAVLIAAISLPASAVATSMLAALDGAGRIATRSRIIGLQTAVIALGGAAFLQGASSVVGAVAMLAVAPVVSAAAAARSLRHHGLWSLRLRPSRAETAWLLRKAAPLAGLAGIAAVYRRFDVLLLSIVSSPVETAAYDLSLRVVEALGFLGSFVSAPALFLLNRRLGAGDVEGAQRVLNQSARLVYLACLPVSVCLVALHRPIVAALFGRNYEMASIPLAILGGQFWLEMVSLLQGSVIASLQSLRPAVRLSVLLLGVIVVLDAVLVPAFGATGAAVATAAFQVGNVVAVRRLTVRQASIAVPFPPVGAIIAAAAAGATLVIGERVGVPPALALLTGAAVYAGGVVATGTVTRDDVRRVLRLTRPA